MLCLSTVRSISICDRLPSPLAFGPYGLQVGLKRVHEGLQKICPIQGMGMESVSGSQVPLASHQLTIQATANHLPRPTTAWLISCFLTQLGAHISV